MATHHWNFYRRRERQARNFVSYSLNDRGVTREEYFASFDADRELIPPMVQPADVPLVRSASDSRDEAKAA